MCLELGSQRWFQGALWPSVCNTPDAFPCGFGLMLSVHLSSDVVILVPLRLSLWLHLCRWAKYQILLVSNRNGILIAGCVLSRVITNVKETLLGKLVSSLLYGRVFPVPEGEDI